MAAPADFNRVSHLSPRQKRGSHMLSYLDTLVESDKVGKLSRIIGQRSHEPVSCRLPGRVEETVEYVQEHRSCITTCGPVHRDVVLGICRRSVIVLLKCVSASPNNYELLSLGIYGQACLTLTHGEHKEDT